MEPGLLFAAHCVLRVGIVVVGLRVSTGQLIQIGPAGLAAVGVISALLLVGNSAMSALAMVSYPLISRLFQFSDQAAGFVMGAAIHDVAPSLGAG